MLPYILKRSRRTTLGIYITKDAVLEVRAPIRTPRSEIDRFLEAKQQWIELHLSQAQSRADSRAAFSITYGDRLTLLGTEYPIQAREGGNIGFDRECFFIPPGLTQDEIKNSVKRVYISLAERMLTERTNEYASILNLQPSTVKISSAKSRWGSCSSKHSINYSWRLIMAGIDVIDYVIVHELAHIHELNHSPRFWAIVESALPDFRLRKQKLKILHEKLVLEDWG